MATGTMEPLKTEKPSGRQVLPAARVSRNGATPVPDSEIVLGELSVESIFRPWWSTFLGEIGEMFNPPKIPAPPKYRDAAPGELDLAPMMLDTLRLPWYQNIVRQFKEFSEWKKLPPLKLTSKPLSLKSIWGAYDYKKEGVLSSVLGHVLLVVLIFTVFRADGPPVPKLGSVTLIIPVDISPYLAQLRIRSRAPAGKSGGGGGGGQNSPLPASKGRLPRFSMTQLAPPTPIIRNLDPKLAVEPTVIVPPDTIVPMLDMAMFGDPLGKIGPPSAGPGTGGGIGSGRGTGVGSGRGAGVGPGSGGGIGGGVFRVGGGVSAPRLTYKVEPEYSEEARKSKYQGTVVLAVEVWEDGRAHNIRVVRSLGLGLDEKAISAVVQWKFSPGKKDGKSVKVAATIEVNFRLL